MALPPSVVNDGVGLEIIRGLRYYGSPNEDVRRSMKSVNRRLAGGVAWTVFGSVISQASVYACAVIAARLLGKATFGQLAIIQSTVVMFANVATLGLGITATKYVSELQTADPKRAGRILGLCAVVTVVTGVLLSAAVFVLAPWLARDTLHAPYLSDELRLSAVFVLFFGMNAYQLGALVGLEAFQKMAWVSLLQSLTAVVLTVGLILMMGLAGAALALSASAFLSWVYYQVLLNRECRKRGLTLTCAGAWSERQVLYGFALPATLSGMASGAANWGGSAVLVRQAGFAELALFSAANNFRTIVTYLPRLVTRVASPILCNLRSEDDAGTYRRALWTNMGICTALAVVAAAVIGALCPILLGLFGSGFADGTSVARLLLAAGVIEVSCWGLFQVIFTHGRLWLEFANVGLRSALMLGIVFLLAGRHGAVGLSVACLASWAFAFPMYAVSARSLLRAGSATDSGKSEGGIAAQ